MQIDVKGRNVQVSEEQRARLRRCFAKIDRQVSPLARLEVEFSREPNPSIADPPVGDLTRAL
jgi:ribosome-associated translation inhibitor RaiA